MSNIVKREGGNIYNMLLFCLSISVTSEAAKQMSLNFTSSF